MKHQHVFLTTLIGAVLGVAALAYAVSMVQDGRYAGYSSSVLVHQQPSDGAQSTEEPRPVSNAVTELPLKIRMMLSQEMFKIESEMRQILSHIARARWDSTAISARRIHETFILKSNMSDDDRTTLTETMPEHFFNLDTEFHDNALKLAEAADARDITEANSYFKKMMGSCIECHRVYATSKFPAFRSEEDGGYSDTGSGSSSGN